MNYKIGVVGLGYVGLPLAIAMSESFDVIGFDISETRIGSLKRGVDTTHEVSADQLSKSEIIFTNNLYDLKYCNVYIITVPTPVDEANVPDLNLIKKACADVGRIVDVNDLVIFESTVFPGTTRDVCGRIISEVSELELNSDYFLGYSPERINPGDKTRSVKDIVKIVSGSTQKATEQIACIYSSVISAGVFVASSLEVAEAAKIIENVQRDINIALVNELSEIFYVAGIDTKEVLEAAGSKWNFHPYVPGLVGGHCIGVDPYYLKYFAEKLNVPSKLISAGREINDSMAKRAAIRLVKKMCNVQISLACCRILIAGVFLRRIVRYKEFKGKRFNKRT